MFSSHFNLGSTVYYGLINNRSEKLRCRPARVFANSSYCKDVLADLLLQRPVGCPWELHSDVLFGLGDFALHHSDQTATLCRMTRKYVGFHSGVLADLGLLSSIRTRLQGFVSCLDTLLSLIQTID